MRNWNQDNCKNIKEYSKCLPLKNNGKIVLLILFSKNMYPHFPGIYLLRSIQNKFLRNETVSTIYLISILLIFKAKISWKNNVPLESLNLKGAVLVQY